MIIRIILVGLIFVIVGMAVTLFCVVQKTPEEREKEDDEQAKILAEYVQKQKKHNKK